MDPSRSGQPGMEFDPFLVADHRMSPPPMPHRADDLRFEAEERRHALRITLGARVLLGGASRVLSRMGSIDRGWLHRAERAWGRSVVRLLRIRIDADGFEHIDPNTAYLVVSLHEGLSDALPLLTLPLGLRFMARDELFAWPALGRYLSDTGQVEVSTNASRGELRKMYREIGETFDAGDSLVIFPQGSVLGVEVAFRAGASRIAAHFSRPVLPVILTGSHRVWEYPYSPTVRLNQTISMRVLPPLSAAAFDTDGARQLERTMKRQALHHSMAPVRRFVPERDGWWDGYDFDIDEDFPDLQRRVAEHRGQ